MISESSQSASPSPEQRVRRTLLHSLGIVLLVLVVGLVGVIWLIATQTTANISLQTWLIGGAAIGAILLMSGVWIVRSTLAAVRASRVSLETMADAVRQDLEAPLRMSSRGDADLKTIISAFNGLQGRVKEQQTRVELRVQELQREREYDAAIIAMMRQLSSTLELEPLLTEFVRDFSKYFDLSMTAVGLLEDNGIAVRYGVLRGDADVQQLPAQWLPLTTGIAGEAVHYHHAVIRRRPPFDTLLRAPGDISTQVALPLMESGQVLGVLIAQSPHSISERGIQRIIHVAEDLATTLANATLYAAARERATSLTAINELARTISSSLNIKQMLGTALQQVRQLVPYDQASVGLFDTDQNVFEIIAATDAYTGPLEMGQTFSGAGTPVRTAFEAGHPVYIAQLEQHDRSMLPPPFNQQTESLLIVPLTTSDTRVGMLNLASRTPHAFTDAQISLLGGLAHFLTAALINGRLFSQRVEAMHELEKAQEHMLLVEKMRAMGELASGITHDFNNVLAGILGNVQLLMLDTPDPEQLETLRVIERAAKDGAETIKRIQGFARNDAHQPDAPVDLKSLAADVIDLTRVRWRNAAQERGINIELQRNLHDVPMIRGYAAELREVITNLVINAVDAMPAGGTLRIATGQRAAEVFIAVADTGVGMSEEVRTRIFDPFFSTKGDKGNGLGLSMSAAIIAGHGGRIEVQSVEGRGTNFIIWLPILEVDLDEVAAHDHDVSNVQGRVLIVEDEQLVRNALGRMLSAWGHTVISAEGGREGLMKFRPGAFDVVISDLGMPDISGWDVLRQVRSKESNVHTVLLTGWARQIDPNEARMRGVDLVIAKPFDQLTLRRTLAHLLEGSLDMSPRIIE